MLNRSDMNLSKKKNNLNFFIYKKKKIKTQQLIILMLIYIKIYGFETSKNNRKEIF